MNIRIADLRYREVINVSTGQRLGYISDVEMDSESGRVLAMIVPGPYRFFGLFGRGEDYVLTWESIIKIGEDIILIDNKGEERREERQRKGLFLL